MLDYLKKMRCGAALPPAPAPGHVLWSWVGGAVAIGLIAFLTTAIG